MRALSDGAAAFSRRLFDISSSLIKTENKAYTYAMNTASRSLAVIIDVSKSRSHDDRRALQQEIQAAFGRVNGIIAARQPLAATIGDEFQAVYSTLGAATRATLLARLCLPDGVDCRFGIGRGEVTAIGPGVAGLVQDGSAWWSAREAIDEARRHEYSKLGFVRTWFRAASGTGSPEEALVNAYLLARDHIVGSMNPRARRLLLGHLLGVTQGDLAEQEGITQSAVSQSLNRNGANALLASEALILEVEG